MVVLDGELAVPCNSQSAIARFNSLLEVNFPGGKGEKWCGKLGPTQRG